MVRGRYDIAQTTDDNRRHWANADSLSADAELLPQIRCTIRNRCRYEVKNNSFAKGIGLTIANDTVGVGPTLQLLNIDKQAKTLIETLFWEWMQEIRFAEKLRQIRFARYDSGEAFPIFVSNEGLYGPVKLDVQVCETEQIADPEYKSSALSSQDGIFYDRFGNPQTYRKLRTHPGSTTWAAIPMDYDDISARFVFHYYLALRPGQLRGIPDITPAIQPFAELRRFCNATIAAAETAAEHAAVIETDAVAEDGNSTDNPTLWDKVELESRGGLVMPSGYHIKQLEAEHPSTTYREFITSKLNEISRCLCMPLHIATMDSGLANMSSSYVVGQMYAQERIVDRSHLDLLMNKALDMWLTEATRVPGLLPALPTSIPRQWFWPSLGHHADPQKVANALTTRLACGMATFPHEYAKEGLDWEEQQELAAKSLGVSLDEYRELLRNKIFGVKPEPDKEKEDDETDEGRMDRRQER